MTKLRIRNGPMAGRERTIEDQPLTIGRDAEAGIQILDRSASRFHAEVFPVGGMFFVRDLKSKNGTFVNDERLEDEELLREADVIKIGTTELVFEPGIALTDDDSSDRIAYSEDNDMLSNTLEFRIDDLSDLQDEHDQHPLRSTAESDNLRILYHVGKLIGKSENHEVTAKVLDFLLEAMPAETALIFLRNRQTGRLHPSTVRSTVPHANPVISRTIIRRTVNENRAFFTANALEDTRIDRKDSIVSQGIRSVVCVPLTVAGQTRGVLYVSRGIGDSPFEQTHMEVLSACSVQLGLAFQAADQRRRQQLMMWNSLASMMQAMEYRSGRQGTGERTAQAATALARALRLSPEATWRLQVAGLLHHLVDLCAPADDDAARAMLFELLGDNQTLSAVLPLIRNCHERLDGTGPLGVGEEDLDTEDRILAVAVAFEERTAENSQADIMAIIDRLVSDRGYDDQIAGQLKGCHIDNSLYQDIVI
ncbi:MAG: FHA domain-containing protein [Planctomycetota bacterium]